MKTRSRDPDGTRRRILDAARDLVLHQGFTATGVGEVCSVAEVSKGAFFHHFESKDALGLAILSDWADFGGRLYAASTDSALDPLDRVQRFFDLMIGFVQDPPGPVTCVIGIISQEQSLANASLRESCAEHLQDWTAFLRELVDEAKESHPPRRDFDSEELAWFVNCLWQGSMLVAKTCNDPEIIVKNLERARTHVIEHFGDVSKLRGARRTRRRQ